jgi:1-phosphatidylinositol-4-phosphate 5-kinase
MTGVARWQGSYIFSEDGNACTFIAGATEFTLLSTELWYFCMILDIRISTTNPFVDYKKQLKKYHKFVWGISTAAAVIMWFSGAAGMSDTRFCWADRDLVIHNDTEFLQINYPSWAFYFLWVIGINLVALRTLIYLYNLLKSRTLSNVMVVKVKILRSYAVICISLLGFWIVNFTLWMVYLGIGIDEENNSQPKKLSLSSNNISSLFLYVATSKGIMNFIAFFATHDISNAMKDDARYRRKRMKQRGISAPTLSNDVDLSPQFNSALRAEILYYTAKGVELSSVQQDQLDQLAGSEDNDSSLFDPEKQRLYIRPPPQGENEDPVYDCTAVPRREDGYVSFKSYRPRVFAKIRRLFGIKCDDFVASFSKEGAKLSLSGGGASGAFMFFSGDSSYIVKSMTGEEHKFLLNIADRYLLFMQSHPNSFLARFYGCFSVKLYGSTYSFVVMSNMFAQSAKIKTEVIYRTYDLKGSWVNRSGKVSTAELFRRKALKTVLKDDDLQTKLQLDSAEAQHIYDALMSDTLFLSELGIMDYSLLLGVVYAEFPCGDGNKTVARQQIVDQRGNDTNGQQDSARLVETGIRNARTVVGPSRYYLGLIDILQEWNTEKKLEQFAKTQLLRKDKHGISCVPCQPYQARFMEKMKAILGLDENADSGESLPYLGRASEERNSSSDGEASMVGQTSFEAPTLEEGRGQDNVALSEADRVVALELENASLLERLTQLQQVWPRSRTHVSYSNVYCSLTTLPLQIQTITTPTILNFHVPLV